VARRPVARRSRAGRGGRGLGRSCGLAALAVSESRIAALPSWQSMLPIQSAGRRAAHGHWDCCCPVPQGTVALRAAAALLQLELDWPVRWSAVGIRHGPAGGGGRGPARRAPSESLADCRPSHWQTAARPVPVRHSSQSRRSGLSPGQAERSESLDLLKAIECSTELE
jgi:hypothetical protein